MADSTDQVATSDITCPDPSKHTEFAKDTGLQDQASRAALLATSHEKTNTPKKQGNAINPLGADGKLSAAGAATSLRYAKPQDLPGFPSVGIDSTTSGQRAATLANQNKSTFEHWKPDASSSASKAALIAHKDGGKLNLWHPEATQAGSSAASMAMNKDHNLSPQLDYGYTEEGKRNSLLAATKSISGSNKPRPNTPLKEPALYPDQKNSAFNAKNAATVAHKPSIRNPIESDRWGSDAMEASRIKNAHLSRDTFTEHPQIGQVADERRHQEALKASAVVMAKQMMEDQKRQSADIANRSDAGDIAARNVHNKHLSQSSIASEDYKSEAAKYTNLQEAARKLAAERLAKLDPDGIVAYREYYSGPTTAPSPRNRLHVRGRRRTIEQEDDGFSSDDEVRAGRIRHQMSNFNKDIASVDEKKRQADRDNLLAAAQKRVSARMADMDEKVFSETGQVSPAMMADWEAKARAKAAANSEQRMANHGKVHIGGGRYMDQSEIDAIAATRLQPTLDEISETAAAKRARDEEIRLEQERLRLEAEAEKQRQAELKAQMKQNVRNEKFRIAQEKRVAKEAEKEERRKLKADKILIVPKGESPLVTEQVASSTIPDEPVITKDVVEPSETIESDGEGDHKAVAEAEPEDIIEPTLSKDSENVIEDAKVDTSTSSPQPAAVSKVRGFFNKLRSKNASSAAEINSPVAENVVPVEKPSESSDLYNASLRGIDKEGESEPVPEAKPELATKSPSPSISSLEEDEAPPTQRIVSGTGSHDEFQEAQDQFDDKLDPPKPTLTDVEGSPSRTASKFREDDMD